MSVLSSRYCNPQFKLFFDSLLFLTQPGEKGFSAVLNSSVDHVVKERREGIAHLRSRGYSQLTHHVSPTNGKVAHAKRSPV